MPNTSLLLISNSRIRPFEKGEAHVVLDMNEDYLLRSHSKEVLQQWASALRFFRFFRAYGGHANDGDSLVVAFRYTGLRDLKHLCDDLGLPLNQLHPDRPKPIPGQRYTFRQFSVFKSEIGDFPDFEQPGHQTIYGEDVFVWCEGGKMKISVKCRGDDGYSVTEDDVESAKRIEAHLEQFRGRVIDPPEDTDHFLCPLYYPDYYGAQQIAEPYK
jgi:hypothetical protein